MFQLGKRARRFKRVPLESGTHKSLFPLNGAEVADYFSIPANDIPTLAERYVKAMETEQTNAWCRCEWIVHPDDTNKPEGKRRIRHGEPAPDCPVHTKEGFLIYFFEWVFKNGN